jgi:3-oxoadipate enol-lactonase
MQLVEGMSVEIEGAGPAVIAIPGLGGTTNTYQTLMETLGAHRVVRLDLPGGGRSPVAQATTLPAIAAQVAAMAAALGIERAVVIGHSLGSIVAQWLAATQPSLVSKLVLLGAIIEPAEAGREGLRKRAALARAEGMAPIADQVMRGGTAAEARAQNPAAAAFVRESVLRQPPEGYALLCEALAAVSAADASRIACPTLLITGDSDQTAPPAVAHSLAGKIAGARAVILAQCGHWPSIERPAETARELKTFLP